ncbi:secreted protein [Melampsora americana]|nr:secreted protein [Melampsora americana]KAH9808353.1 secreted protein [Melampsora americana]
MFYTRILICIGLVTLFQQMIEGQCLPLRGHAPISKEQCYKALSTYQFDENGLLDSDGFENKKTCGNCKISLSVVNLNPRVKPSLDGLLKSELQAVLNTLSTGCTYDNAKSGTMLPSIFVGETLKNTFVSVEIEVGDLKRNECSSTPRKQNHEARSSKLTLSY